ncbi:hypothetical protein [Tichowtungia aerotolerans]|uniref:Uncharacterized protein n=1 Tax=Tichowtungia aerotolerans TaxID=2697043 RepID=A0A6P1MCL0_9BACT|nr:hypothetical protein [Tichowtungia aerotolerans]QHI68825.1 hypothetical protein GT409_04960 [Tichowtungia aerotolerans]
MSGFAYAVWLVPCEEQREPLQQIIDSLAAEFKTPTFVPHATLCSGVWKNSESELIKQVRKLPVEFPLELQSAGIDWTEHWSTYFVLRLGGKTDLFKKSAAQLPGSHAPKIGPHLSLLYGFNASRVDRNALRATLNVPPAVCFNSLMLVRPETGRWEDVDFWEELGL